MGLDLSWQTFQETMLRPALPAVHNVWGNADTRLFVDSGARRIGLWLLVQETTSFRRRGGIVQAGLIESGGQRLLEISTSTAGLFAQFFALADDVMNRVQAGLEPGSAVLAAIRAWRELLKSDAELSRELLVGLWGELWTMRWLLRNGLEAGHWAWIGPLGEPHDLRLQNGVELEIKSSENPTARHSITSLHQLVPSSGFQLWLLSLLLAPVPAGGESLQQLAAEIRASLAEAQAEEFDDLLALVGVQLDGSEASGPQFTLRSPPRMIPITPAAPRLTPEMIREALGPENAARIESVVYSVDFSGLGTPLAYEALAGTQGSRDGTGA
jgi:hypothetical protein